MTDPAAPTTPDIPEPMTKAGRALLRIDEQQVAKRHHPRIPRHVLRQFIHDIEAEAHSTPAEALDVERLYRMSMWIDCGYGTPTSASEAIRAKRRIADGPNVNCCDEHRAIAAEYARLRSPESDR